MTLNLSAGKFSFGVKRAEIQMRPVTVGKVKMPPVHIPPATKIVAMKQYRIPGGHKEIGETVKELVEAGVMRPTTTAWNNPVWPVKKSDGSWRMTVDYRELNKHTPPLTAAVPDTITIVENIQTHEGTWYAVIDLANAFFTIPIEEKAQDQFAFTWLGRQYTFTRLPQGWLHSPTICHRTVAEHLDELKLPSDMQFSHYIDDIMIQGTSEEAVREQLAILLAHMKQKGWEINEAKIQGPSQTVKFLGIQWNKGHREILPKARQKILNFPVRKTKQETQSYIGLFGFWRQHIPHLGLMLAPLYKVTRKKYEFHWGEEQQTAFEMVKEAIQQAVDLWPMTNGPVELHVTVQHMYANWSLWQKQGGKRVPLGFWNRKLPDAGEKYTPFEQQLLACYWALVETEQLTLGHEVLLRPLIPIMQWVLSNPKTNRVGHAQEQSIIKWKWYVSERAKKGEGGTATLHEKVAEIGDDIVNPLEKASMMEESPVKWGKTYEDLTADQQEHAWFTDGSARYVGGKRLWKSVAYNPKLEKHLQMEGEGKSSQYAELYAVFLAIAFEKGRQCHVFTDSWSVANGLATWMMGWKKHNWMIHGKEIWGREVWQYLEEMVQETPTTVFHVDAHMPIDSLEHLFNSEADKAAAIRQNTTEIDAGEKEAWLQGTAVWAHQKRGHLGEKATYRWAQERGVPLTLDIIKQTIQHCPICQHSQKREVPHTVMGHIGRGQLPAQIWQMDFIGPLSESRGCKYVCTAVDTYSGLMVGFPCKAATQWSTERTLEIITQYYGVPLQIQTDNGSHFTGDAIKKYAQDNNIQWVYHIPYYPQAAGLVERMNGLLKSTLRKLNQSDTQYGQWRDNLSEALQIINNRPITNSMTPLMRMLTLNLTIHEANLVKSVVWWKTDQEARIPERATPHSAGLDLSALETVVIPQGKVKPIATGLGCQIPKDHYGQIATRSSLALKGAMVVGGVIDADYQGEIKVLMINLGNEPLILEKGQRIAQMLLIPINLSDVQEGTAPSELTIRGSKGFGSSNITNVGAKIWVQNTQGPPSEAEVLAVGKDHTLLIMRPGVEKWEYIPQEKCYLRE
ncbi:uncharacterized protein [Dendrobates tinctorius]|uniref:uncharacterized protein n=1 Tax=Dendrobates tinctorius TaxID=92724 RepID=UPI003CCA4F75